MRHRRQIQLLPAQQEGGEVEEVVIPHHGVHGAIVGAFGEVMGEEVVRDEFVGVFEDAAEPEEIAIRGVASEGAVGGDG